MQNGDTVKILTANNQKPSPEWIKIAQNQRVKNRIKHIVTGMQNRLAEINVNNGIFLKYFYNDNKLQSIKEYMDDELQCTWNIIYDSHAISEIDVKWTEAGALNRKKLTVNPLFFMSKEIANMVCDRKSVKEGEYDETYLFTYKNGDFDNVAQCKMNFQGSEYVVDYKYDKKNNPLCGNFGLFDFDFTKMISQNNIVESVSSSVNQDPAVLKYEYTYLDDYPLTEISKNKEGVILEKITYTYVQ